MKRILLVPLLTVTLGSLVAMTSGCADPCEDLSEICGQCADETYRTSCEDTVRADVQGVCNARLDLYNTTCPYGADLSSTSSGGGGGAGGTTSSGTGGTTSSGTGGTTSGSAGSGGVGGAGGAAGGSGGSGGSGGA